MSRSPAEIALASLVLAGLGCLLVSAVVPVAGLSETLTRVAIGLAGLGVVIYLVSGWNAGAMGTTMGVRPEEAARGRDPGHPEPSEPDDE
jgi:hypothetical protein